MRWVSEKNKAQAIFYYIATAVLILVIIGMSVDFISWRNAIGMIKKQVPTVPTQGMVGRPPLMIKGVGWVPFVWRGNFTKIKVYTDGEKNNIGYIVYVDIGLKNWRIFEVPLSNGYGERSFTREEKFENLNPPFDDVLVFAKLIDTKINGSKATAKLLIYMEGEKSYYGQKYGHTNYNHKFYYTKHYVRIVPIMLYYYACRGRWEGVWKK